VILPVIYYIVKLKAATGWREMATQRRGEAKILRTQGIVLRYTNFKESDRMLTLFSPELGKMSVLARGCRKPKSRFLAATQLFAYGEYVLHKKGEIYILTQGDIIDSFFDIRGDVEKFAYASYIINLVEEVAVSEEQNTPLFSLLLQILSYLAYSDINPEDITHVFEIKLIDITGYRPQLDVCMTCGSPLSGSLYFQTSKGGLICSKCYKQDKRGYNIHMGTVQIIRYILDMDIKRMNILKISPEFREQLDKILSAYLEERLEKRLKTRRFIEHLHRFNSDN
jgi:DNA repair protein RecO (recombination protein O)